MILTYEERLASFERMSPSTLINLFLESLSNCLIQRELKPACDQGLWYCLLMGMHACILTINEQLFGYIRTERRQRFKQYLENFIDGKIEGLHFSMHSNKIYDRRNVLAHQWFGKIGHHFGMDDTIEEGIVENNGVIILNPRKYFEQFSSSFNPNAYCTNRCIRDYADDLEPEEKEKAKVRIIERFKNS